MISISTARRVSKEASKLLTSGLKSEGTLPPPAFVNDDRVADAVAATAAVVAAVVVGLGGTAVLVVVLVGSDLKEENKRNFIKTI